MCETATMAQNVPEDMVFCACCGESHFVEPEVNDPEYKCGACLGLHLDHERALTG